MRRRLRGWWSGRTLRWRLIAGLLVLLVLTCTAIGLATTVALRGFLVQRLDQQLADAGPRLAFSLEHPSGQPVRGDGDGDVGLDQGVLRGQQVGTLAARLVGGQLTSVGVIQVRDDQAALVTPNLSAHDAATVAGLPATGRPTTVDLGPLGHYRASAVPGVDGDVLVTALPLEGVTATLYRLETIEAVVFAAVLVLAGLASAGWVRLSLRPLHRVSGIARAVAQTPLSSGDVSLPTGVPDTNPATEVGQLGAAFNQMLAHVQAGLTDRQVTEARLRQFVADASHELRTPLAAIRSHAELAARRHGSLPDDVAHALRRVEAESARMGVLVDDLLLLARLDAGRPLASDEVDLTRLAIDVTSDARASGPEHRWRLELPDEPVTVYGDSHRLHQVVANLLANASTHTPPGSTVTVCLAARAEAAPDMVELSVADDGPGIPAELRAKVFERFVRADTSRTRATGSTGLGLAIVAAVVQAHHGSVELESTPGQTRFRVLLPAP